jgi:AbiU2
MTAEEKRFTEAFTTFETQVAETTQFWLAASTMNEVAKHDPNTLEALNKAPTFWITVKVALEYQAIISAGKIFGNRKANLHNIDSFFQVLRESYAVVFAASTLEARKRQGSANAAEWLSDYMMRVYVPTIDDVNALHCSMRPHRKTYETQWAQIRNQHVAHTDVIDPTDRWEMFQKTRIPDFENLIGYLNWLQNAIWHLYHNGIRPDLAPTNYSLEALVAKPIRELQESRNDEHIIAETRRCMALLTQGVASVSVGV